ncbi:MAG: ABC transporter permease [Oscillospiraceae bacterium]
MFLHIFKYQIKQHCNEKSVLFWLMLYPVIMALLFYGTLTNIKDDLVDSIPAAVVVEQPNADFTKAMTDSGMFDITDTDAANAAKLLADGKVDVIVTVGADIRLTIGANGINQSIAAVFVSTYEQTVSTITNIAVTNPEALNGEALTILTSGTSYLTDAPINSNNDTSVIYFYTLIAMSCFMCGTAAVAIMAKMQANQSALAARINVAPVHKLKAFTASMLASLFTQIFYNFILVFFLWKILGIGFGSTVWAIFLLVVAGCFSGMMVGFVVSAFVKGGEGLKSILVIAITLTGCFFSGMMSTEVKYTVMTNHPFLASINPLNRITDALYTLYYYGVNRTYWNSVLFLSVLGVVLCAATYFILKNQTYRAVSNATPDDE